jgi:hypothetical protein
MSPQGRGRGKGRGRRRRPKPGPGPDLPLTSFRRLEIDFESGLAKIEVADGAAEGFPLQSPPTVAEAGMRRGVYDTASHEFVVTLPMGEEVALEMVGPGMPWPAPPGPVVYLDQLHWITLAQAVWAPEKIEAPVQRAAERLIELARERAVCLPFSAGNLTEMTQMDGRRRRHLATLILELSRGWQMRNPIAVRGEELGAILRGQDPQIADVFTLRTGEVFAHGLKPVDPPDDFPPEWQHWFKNLTAVSAMVAGMIDDEPLSAVEGKAMAERWAGDHHDLALRLRQGESSKAEVRRASLAKLASDLASEIVPAAQAAGLNQGQLAEWYEGDFEGDLARMPYLGRQYEVIRQRLSNADDLWEANDLTDINYLSCAAAYADVMVGEKKTTEYLKRARNRVPDGAFLCRRLSEAVAHLEGILGNQKSGEKDQ